LTTPSSVVLKNMAVKILHVADVHLDRPFVGMSTDVAHERRRDLRDAFDRCLDLAKSHGVDALTIGGDLWEDEHVTPDTCRWVADRLGRLGLPVVMVAGNHDPLRRGGPYQRVQWPENVHLLPAERGLQNQDVGPISIWGMSWGASPLTSDDVSQFTAPSEGTHLLLLHGTVSSAAFQDDAHCRFSADSVRDAGFALCLAGHLHSGGLRDSIVLYPGSPEPLAWHETGRHTAAIIELEDGAPPEIQLVEMNERRYAEITVDCAGATSSADIERALAQAISAVDNAREGLCLRAVLRGRVEPDCRIDTAALCHPERGLTQLELRDETQPAFDIEMLAAQPTAIGAFVTSLQRQIQESEADQRPHLQLALDLGLRAMHGDELANAS
jgi:DNA repair protein SbcD/Mre11